MSDSVKRVIDRRITVLEEQSKRTFEVLQRVDERTEHLDHIIRGNGNPGIATDMQLVKAKIAEIQTQVVQSEQARKDAETTKSNHRWELWTAVGSLAFIEIAKWIFMKG